MYNAKAEVVVRLFRMGWPSSFACESDFGGTRTRGSLCLQARCVGRWEGGGEFPAFRGRHAAPDEAGETAARMSTPENRRKRRGFGDARFEGGSEMFTRGQIRSDGYNLGLSTRRIRLKPSARGIQNSVVTAWGTTTNENLKAPGPRAHFCDPHGKTAKNAIIIRKFHSREPAELSRCDLQSPFGLKPRRPKKEKEKRKRYRRNFAPEDGWDNGIKREWKHLMLSSARKP